MIFGNTQHSMQEKTKVSLSTTGIVFLVVILLGVVFVLHSYFSQKNILTNEVLDNLTQVNISKTEKIREQLESMHGDIVSLQTSPEVKHLLKHRLVDSAFSAQENIQKISENIAAEVNAYLITHPQATVGDLQASEVFERLAVQPVGQTGYSAVYEAQSLINRFHPNPAIVNNSFDIFAEEFPNFYDIVSENRAGKDSGGFYDWRDADGVIRSKYMYATMVDTKTADDIKLVVAATTYTGEYKTVELDHPDDITHRHVASTHGIHSDVEIILSDVYTKSDYNNIVLISKEGSIIYLAQGHERLGVNLEWKSSLDYGLAKNYQKTKQANNITLYGPFIERYGDVHPQFSVMAPISESGLVLGYVALVDDMERIFEITEATEQLEETGESFLVNQDLILISPLRHEDFDIMIQTVDTENSRRCFSMPVTGEHVGHQPADVLLNYQGERVVAAHSVIWHPQWCLLSEIEKTEVIDEPLYTFVERRIYVAFAIVFLSTLLVFFIDYRRRVTPNTTRKNKSRKNKR